MRVKIYVEGGGNDNSRLCAELRQGFQSLFIKAGFGGKLPSVIASGGRAEAFHDFQIAIRKSKLGEVILLLVDSEGGIEDGVTKWDYVKTRVGDNWEQPKNANENNLFFMIECMESWFLADKDALKNFYGKDFHENSLLKNTNFESISKQNVYSSLENATKGTIKGRYGKGTHSFKILGMLDPQKIKDHGTYAREFFERIEELS